MSNPERQQRLEEYSKSYQLIRDLLEQHPTEARTFKPDPADWSAHEIVAHLTDSEANNYVRARKIIAEPGSTVMTWDETPWYNASNYAALDLDEVLTLYRSLHTMTYRLLVNLPDETWANQVNHPELDKLSLDDWLRLHLQHTNIHLNQMRQNYEKWKAV